MTRVRGRGEKIRRFILNHVEKHPTDIAKLTAEHFEITRQAVNKHLQKLTSEKMLVDSGKTRNRVYKLCAILEWERTYSLTNGLAEDVVWRNDIFPALGEMPDNVTDIWHYGITEMLNNAIDHSNGAKVKIFIRKTAVDTNVIMMDDGVGIFRKIQTALNLLDERHSVLELSKGKLTTDPARHTGEGIFFTSRMFDDFTIVSGAVYFSHEFGKPEDWIIENENREGTTVFMKQFNHASRTTKKVFDKYSSEDDYGFTRTVVPVRFAQYGDDKLISRSQAKRLLARVELFKTVILDFSKVESIGRAFADEIFRVFANKHPEIELFALKGNSAVKRMITKAKSISPNGID